MTVNVEKLVVEKEIIVRKQNPILTIVRKSLCSDSPDPLGNSCFCNNTLCQKGNICSGNECTQAATPEEESITKKFVKTVVKTFLVGLTIALPLSLVLYLMFIL